MVNTANANTPANKSAKAGARFFPILKDVVPYHAEVEFKQLRSMAYDLIDLKLDVIDKTLTANTLIDRDLVAGRLLEVIARQDVVGGWTVQFATNKDGSTKFKDTSFVTQNTTANSYTAYLFLAISETEAILIAHEPSGGGGSSSTSGDASLFDPSRHLLIRNYTINGATSLDINDGKPSGLTVVGASSFGSSAGGEFVLQTSGGGLGGRATFVTTATLFQQAWSRNNGEISFRWAPITNSTTNNRMWVGLCLEDISDEATSTPTKSYAVFRYATDIDGTVFWRCASDNGSGTPEVTTTTIPIIDNTLYRFRIRWINDGSYIKFYNDEVLVATHTSKIPSTTTLTRWIASMKALAAETKVIAVQWVNFWF